MVILAVVGPTAGRWYVDVSSGVPPKQFVQGEWFVGMAALTGLVWLGAYELGASIACPPDRLPVRLHGPRDGAVPGLGGAARQGANRRLEHDDGRPMLGRKLKDKSKREMDYLGLGVHKDGEWRSNRVPERPSPG